MEERVAVHYVAVLNGADDEFFVHFPDLPGCFARGATRDQACRFAAETLAFHLQRFTANHLTVPATSSLEAIRADPEHRHAILMLVEAATLPI